MPASVPLDDPVEVRRRMEATLARYNALGLALQVEPVGLREDLGIAVRRAQPEAHRLALADRGALEGQVRHGARRVRHQHGRHLAFRQRLHALQHGRVGRAAGGAYEASEYS